MGTNGDLRGPLAPSRDLWGRMGTHGDLLGLGPMGTY